MAAYFEPTMFRPRELARITGLSAGMQRDWRSRGFLPSPPAGAHARFDAPAVARILVMQTLAGMSIGPNASGGIAARAAAMISTRAVHEQLASQAQAFFDQLEKAERDRWYAGPEFPANAIMIGTDGVQLVASVDRLAQKLMARAGKPVVSVNRSLQGPEVVCATSEVQK